MSKAPAEIPLAYLGECPLNTFHLLWGGGNRLSPKVRSHTYRQLSTKLDKSRQYSTIVDDVCRHIENGWALSLVPGEKEGQQSGSPLTETGATWQTGQAVKSLAS